MSISAKDVKRLRDLTGVGMMDCKKALTEAEGDFDAAIDLLRKKGQKVAAKRAEKSANEGLVLTAVSEDGKRGAIVEINCETDFVARSDDFTAFANEVAKIALDAGTANLDALLAADFQGQGSVSEAVNTVTGKVGEKVEVRRVQLLESNEGTVVPYIHPGSRLGVLVEMHGNGNSNDAGRDVAMQVAALNPIATRSDEVPQETQDKELRIGRETAIEEGKPEHIVDKIAQGKLKRFFKDNVLVEQPFVKDSSKTVQEMLNEAGVDVKRFLRFALGD